MAEEVKTSVEVQINATPRDEFSTKPIGRKWEAFKKIYSCTFSGTLIASLFFAIFCIPAITWLIIYTTFFINKVGTSFPYGVFDGLGYASASSLSEGFNTATVLGNLKFFELTSIEFAVLYPCIMVCMLGLGGLAYVARMAIFGKAEKIVGTFFKGVGYTWLPSLISGALLGLCVFLIAFCATVFDAYGAGIGWTIAMLITSGLLTALVAVFAFYSVVLSANYKVKLSTALKTSLALTFKRFGNTALTVLFAGLIVGLSMFMILSFGDSSLGSIMWMLVVFVAFYAGVGVFVTFDLSAFETSINPFLETNMSKVRAEEAYAAIRAAKASGEKPAKKQTAQKFVNPKKKKKADKQPEVEQKKTPTFKNIGGYSEEELKKMEEDKSKLGQTNVSDEDLALYTDDEA